MSEAGTSPKPSLSVPGFQRGGDEDDDMTTPTTPTPRPRVNFSDQSTHDSRSDEAPAGDPTQKDSSALMQEQRPLPAGPFPPSIPNKAPSGETTKPLTRDDSQHSVHSVRSIDSHDIEMAEVDEDQEGLDGSEEESVASDSENPPKKKKKGQRFYCTDFPPCHLSFTRSEHLARHIRKHTGERPFQCHCSRRFSRLDNLRQHAQTVHVNEEIPNDSLAATGTRFQRQIRTDRVRPPTSRPRATTGNSHGGHSRGHSRNLSASSVISNTSSVGVEDMRARPAPLALHQDGQPHARHSVDFSFNPAIGNAGTPYTVFQQPQSGFNTPTSSTYSAGAPSPQYSSGMPSPPANLSRSSFYNGSRTHSRRLSVPSGSSPNHMVGHIVAYPPPYPNSAPGPPSSSSQMASPTSSVFSHGRRESDVGDGDWRRRTWHPGTQSSYVPRPATSGLSYHQTPDDAKPTMSSQPAASQVTRLPGIESFDHAPQSAAAAAAPPSRNVTSPVQVDQYGRPAYPPPPQEAGPDERRPSAWEAGLQQNLNRLDIGSSKPPSWHSHSRSLSSSRSTTAPHTGFYQAMPLQPPAEMRQGPFERERGTKRQAWYGGPVAGYPGSQPILIGHRTSPESISSDGIPTPSTSQGREMHPAIRHANGMIEMPPPSLVPSSVLSEEQQRMMQAHYQNSKPEPVRADSGFQPYPQGQMPPAYMMQSGHDLQVHQPGYVQGPPRESNDMGRLEALVAVATSENRAVEHRS